MAKRLLIFFCLLSGCSTLPDPAFERADGTHIMPGSRAERQFEVDKTICQGEVDKANLSGTTTVGGVLTGAIDANNRLNESAGVARGCMAQRGYVIVPSKTRYTGMPSVAVGAAPTGTAGPYFGPVTNIPHN